MAQPHGMRDLERLQRYLPHDLAAVVAAYQPGGTALPQLVEAFVHLAAARYTLTTYLPQQLVRQLLDEHTTSPWLRQVDGSLLFADLSGSTALAEQLSTLGRQGTELVTEFLNHIFALMIKVVQSYGGDLVAFGGDALLVFFSDERHPRTAVRAALALQQALAGYEQTVPGLGTFPMHLHIGVESGPLVFLSAGQPHALHHSVIGATVNRVALAEGHAGPGQVVVGPTTWAAVASIASGSPCASGFVQIEHIRPPTRPHTPLPDILPDPGPLDEAIPPLLDDLDRLSPYIPPALLGRVLTAPQQPSVEADLRPVTVLFAQVVGLELLAETLPPELAAPALQIYTASMQGAIDLCGGMVNKLDVAEEGIKLVAVFGAPTAYEDHAERATRAALEMQKRMASVRRQIAALIGELPAGFDLRQRIGLNLGTAFAGNVGSESRKEYTVMGDAVNVAARVMSQALWNETWCSEAIAHKIFDRIDCEARGEVRLRGKTAPLALFRLVGERDTQAAIIMRLGISQPLVGREDELNWLRAHLHAAIAGSGRAVRISGDAGVGKSRLTTELLEQAIAHGVRVIPAICLSYTATIPYAAWGEWLKALCGIVSGDSDDVRLRKIADQLSALGPGMAEWLPLLSDLARLDVADNWLTRGLEPQMRQERRFELIEQLLLNAAAAGPLLVLFEDLHWADSISLDLWRRVAGALAGRPILLLGVQRPSLPADFNDGAHLLNLGVLSEAQSRRMAAELAGSLELPEPMLQQLVRRASGNPLFLAELLHAVITEQRALDELPDSLSGLLLERIDRLDETSRGVLRIASVIGQRIPFGVLRSIQGADQDTLLRHLSQLDDQQLTVLERTEPERVHTFRHALIQEVAYQSMLYARRRELHGRIGLYLERRYGSDLDDYYGLLAHHYRLSDRRDKAIEYLLKAGHAARNDYANDEALQYYTWALDALSGDEADPRSWETRDACADVYATIGRYDEALAQHAAILAVPNITPEVARLAHGKSGAVLEKQGQYSQALDELDKAMVIARSGAPDISPLAVPQICADIGLVHKRRAEYDEAIAACEQGLRALNPTATAADERRIAARLHSELGGIYGMRGDYVGARHHFEHSLQVRESIDDLPGVIFSQNNLGYLWQLQSEYERALTHYQIAEELAHKINLRYVLIFAANNIAYALISLGAYDEAEKRCFEALDISREMNDVHNIGQIYTNIGIISYRKGEYERALGAFEDAVKTFKSLGSAYQEGNAQMNIALTLNSLEEFDAAIEIARHALERAQLLQAQVLKIETLNALAEAMLGKHDLDTAMNYAEQAASLSESIGSKEDCGVALRLLGQIEMARQQPHEHLFDRSIELFTEGKNRFELARTWAAYGSALTERGSVLAGRAYLKQAQEAFISLGSRGELQRLAPILERSV